MVDAGKQIEHEERRKERAKDVSIQFIDGMFQHFNVLATEDEYDKKDKTLIKFRKGEIKYYGVIIGKEPNERDFCTCSSAWFGNTDEFKKASPIAFQCKHIMGAREQRYEGYPV